MAPFLVPFDQLGTIYEGVSFFITGVNVVAICSICFVRDLVFVITCLGGAIESACRRLQRL